MNQMKKNNYRMGSYALIAVGLINLRYQSGQNSNLLNSLLLLIPGALLFGATFLKVAQRWLDRRLSALLISALGVALLIWAFIN